MRRSGPIPLSCSGLIRDQPGPREPGPSLSQPIAGHGLERVRRSGPFPPSCSGLISDQAAPRRAYSVSRLLPTPTTESRKNSPGAPDEPQSACAAAYPAVAGTATTAASSTTAGAAWCHKRPGQRKLPRGSSPRGPVRTAGLHVRQRAQGSSRPGLEARVLGGDARAHQHFRRLHSFRLVTGDDRGRLFCHVNRDTIAGGQANERVWTQFSTCSTLSPQSQS